MIPAVLQPGNPPHAPPRYGHVTWSPGAAPIEGPARVAGCMEVAWLFTGLSEMFVF